MAASTEVKSATLRKLLLVESNLDNCIVDYIMKSPPEGLGMQSIADFANFFAENNYEDQVNTDILDKTDKKDNPLQRGRLRTAWRLAHAQFKSAIEKVGKGLPGDDDDLDQPLDQEVTMPKWTPARTHSASRFHHS